MGALLAKAFAVATIAWGAPCPVVTLSGATTCVMGTHVYMDVGDGRWINHELGHVFDYAYLTNADRGTFEYLAHLDAPWYGAGPGYGNTAAEQFAEAFRSCMHSPLWPPRFVYEGYYPTIPAHRRTCRWMETLASRPQLSSPTSW